MKGQDDFIKEAAQFDRYKEAQDALLAWAREKARKPFVFRLGLGGPICDFCNNVSAVMYDGTMQTSHAPGCLALRAIAEGVA